MEECNMGKSLYSLILSDEIIEAIDTLAYKKRTNRSQLINDILAERVGLLTPEQKVRKIIGYITQAMSIRENIHVKTVNECSSIQFGTFLKYKYNPSIRYSYEFYTSNDHKYAVLKVSSRTKSEELSHHLVNFFSILSAIDQKRFNELHAKEIVTQISDQSNNRFYREFLSGISLEGVKEDRIGRYLSNYLLMLDQALKLYFSHIGEVSMGEITKEIDKIYCHYLQDIKFPFNQ